MAGLNTFNITDYGLFNINKKIVNSRTYASDLITTVGEPTVINGVASDFSADSYFVHSPLLLEEANKILITFKGIFSQSNNRQCAWELLTSNNEALTLMMDNTSISITYNTYIILSLSNLNFQDESDTSIFLTLTSNSFEFVLNCGKNTISRKGTFEFTVPISSFNSLNLGSTSLNREEVWAGSVTLKEFTIYKNGSVAYSPSTGTSWNFSNILISDGELVLSDNTEPTLGHVYSFPVTEITRSGSTVLLTCEVDEEAYLTIREIGLYIQTSEGKVLFGSIGNLNIRKSKDLVYDLIFTVNTTINVVNAVGFPAENGIIVEDPNFAKFKDITTVKEVNTYVLTNLERIIRMNAGGKGSYENSYVQNVQDGIGYNRSQVFYRLQQELEGQEDCYNSIDTFTKLTNRFQEVTERQIDMNNINVIGSLDVPLNGEVSDFTLSDYVTVDTSFSDTSAWNLETSFTTNNSNNSGTIVSMGSIGNAKSMEMSIMNNICYLQMSKMESVEVDTPLVSPSMAIYMRDALRDSTVESTPYYRWKSNSDESNSLYNIHCNNLPVSESPLITFPYSETILIEHPTMDSVFELRIRFKCTDIASTQYIIGKPDSTHLSLELFLIRGVLKANLYDENLELISNSLSCRYRLKTDTFYDATISYDGEKYSLSYKEVVEEGDYSDSEDATVYSNRVISLDSLNNLIVGNRNSTDRVWATGIELNLGQYNNWSCLTYGNNNFIVMNAAGYVSYSADGLNWTLAAKNNNLSNCSAVTYGNGKFVTIGVNGYTSTSTDGITWTQSAHNNNLGYNPYNAIAYGNGKFIAIDGTHAYISTSTNGTTWTSYTQNTNLGVDHAWEDVAYGNGKFVAIGSTGYVSTSTDGTTWIAASQNANLGSHSWTSITYDGSKFVAISSTGYTSTSTNGTTWTEAEYQENLKWGDWSTVAYGNNKIVAISKNGYTSVSNDSMAFQGDINFYETSLSDSSDTWNGASTLSAIYTLYSTPADNSQVYDKDFYEIHGASASNYKGGLLINNEGLFAVNNDTKYNVSISYSENESTQKGTYLVKKHTPTSPISTVYTKVVDIENDLSNRMNVPTTTFIGVSSDDRNPFRAQVNLTEWVIEQGGMKWDLGKDVYTNTTELLQYYRVPNLNKNQYSTKDICDLKRKLRILMNRFEGNGDLINFAYDRGLTLCTKVDLKDTEPKILLYKSNLIDKIYFSLSFIDQTLKFTMSTIDGDVTLSKALTIEEYDSYVSDPIMVTIIVTPQYDNYYYVQMFRNNEAITESLYVRLDMGGDPSAFILSNYVQSTSTDEEGRYVSDIVVIKGAVSTDDLNYINNLFDTNH